MTKEELRFFACLAALAVLLIGGPILCVAIEGAPTAAQRGAREG